VARLRGQNSSSSFKEDGLKISRAVFDRKEPLTKHEESQARDEECFNLILTKIKNIFYT
jgi:hypothetical protein